MAARMTHQYSTFRTFTTLSSMSHNQACEYLTHNVRAKYSSLPEPPKQNEAAQQQLLSALGKVACAGSRCLQTNGAVSEHWQKLSCIVCDSPAAKDLGQRVYWDRSDRGEDWKEVITALLAITKEPKFQNSAKPRVLMAVAIGRLFDHISDPDYLNLETCELGQWLLASLSRSLRELKIAAA